MKVRWNRIIGILLLSLSGVEICLLFSIFTSNLRPDFLSVSAGLVGLGLGILFLRGTYFEVTSDCLILRALIGPARKTYPFTSRKEISIDGARVFFAGEGKRQKLPIHAWMANHEDWEAFVAWLQSKN